MLKSALVFVAFILLHSSLCHAAIIHVPGDSTTIQAGIDGAAVGDTIRVADGHYTGEGNRDLDFGGRALVLKSANGPEATVIDCAGDSTTFHRAMIVEPVSGGVPVIKGFTIIGGYADYGSAIFCKNSAAINIDSCVFRGNQSSEQGVVAGFDSCTFIVSHCLFEENSAKWAAGIYSENHNVITLSNTVFRRNTNGAILLFRYNSTHISECLFERNHGYCFMAGDSGTSDFSNTTFFANEGVSVTAGPAEEVSMERCLIAYGTHQATMYFTPAAVSCCNIYGNAGGDWEGQLKFMLWENGNISFDPHFCDTAAGDLRVTDRSPCAPANNECGVQIGAFPVGCTDSLNVWRIKPDGTGDLPTIQEAIDSCYPYSDTIICDSGLYVGEGNRDIDFHGKQIVLQSKYGPEHTVIDCQGSDTNPARGFIFQNREDSAAIIDGFTIRGGYQAGMNAKDGGGAVLCRSTSPALRHCWFTDNTADIGGAMACVSRSAPMVEYCVFAENTALLGGGLYCLDQSSPTLTNCTIVGNTAAQSGSALTCITNSRPPVDNCILAFNEGDVPVSCFQPDPPSFRCSDIFGHAAGDWSACVAYQEGTNGNFSADPWFCDPALDDYHVDRFGPCSPEQSPCGELIGALDVGCACNCPGQGDCDDDGLITPSDLVYLVNYTLRGGDALATDPYCPLRNRGEYNCDGRVNLVDIVGMINYIYKSSGAGPCDPCAP